MLLYVGTKRWRLSSAGRASALQAEGRGFEPLSLHHFFADLAQLVEQLTCNQQVEGSIPLVGTIYKTLKYGGVAKWLNAADCKSVPSGSAVRICPPPPFIGVSPSGKAQDFDSCIPLVRIQLPQPNVNPWIKPCRCSSMVELQPSKLTT